MLTKKIIEIGTKGIYAGTKYRLCKHFNIPQKPTFLIYHLTDLCNSKCKMCNIWKKTPLKELSIEDIESFANQEIFSEIKWINLTGGEPFMRKDIKRTLQSLYRLPSLEGIAIPTNGFLTEKITKVSSGVLKLIPKNKFLSVTVSIDGKEKTHDFIRGVHGAYDKSVATFKALNKIRATNFNVGIQPTISKLNLEEIEQIYNMWAGEVSVGFAVMMAEETYYNNKGNKNSLSFEDKKIVADFLKENSFKEPQYGFYYHKLAELLEGKKRGFGCLAGYKTMYMNPQGEISPCPILCDKYPLGTYNTEEWSKEKGMSMRKRLKQEPLCRTCSMMCDYINFIKEDFFEFAFFMATHPKLSQKLFKKFKDIKNPYI